MLKWLIMKRNRLCSPYLVVTVFLFNRSPVIYSTGVCSQISDKIRFQSSPSYESFGKLWFFLTVIICTVHILSEHFTFLIGLQIGFLFIRECAFRVIGGIYRMEFLFNCFVTNFQKIFRSMSKRWWFFNQIKFSLYRFSVNIAELSSCN